MNSKQTYRARAVCSVGCWYLYHVGNVHLERLMFQLFLQNDVGDLHLWRVAVSDKPGSSVFQQTKWRMHILLDVFLHVFSRISLLGSKEGKILKRMKIHFWNTVWSVGQTLFIPHRDGFAVILLLRLPCGFRCRSQRNASVWQSCRLLHCRFGARYSVYCLTKVLSLNIEAWADQMLISGQIQRIVTTAIPCGCRAVVFASARNFMEFKKQYSCNKVREHTVTKQRYQRYTFWWHQTHHLYIYIIVMVLDGHVCFGFPSKFSSARRILTFNEFLADFSPKQALATFCINCMLIFQKTTISWWCVCTDFATKV